MSSWFETFQELKSSGVEFVVVTQTAVRGHAPQNIGARAFIGREGLIAGTVGGGKVEARAIEHAQLLLENRDTTRLIESVTWNLTRDIGMTCGGEASFLFEVHGRSDLTIRLFGAGHVAQAVVRASLPLSCRITVIDPRPEWLEKMPRDPKIEIVCNEDMPAVVKRFSRDDYFLVLTRGHASDLPVLRAIYSEFGEPRYIGCMGSDVKALKLRKELSDSGVTSEAISRFRCPIGIRVGRNDPAEIAISILAEVLERRDSSDPSSKWRDSDKD